jgi:mono/diheme cytochrome c family protein
MRRPAAYLLLISAIAALSGCGAKSETPADTEQPAATAPAPDTTVAAATTSAYDAGPRAGEQPVNGGMAAKGEKLFTTKGCVVCHGFGKVITCPDLNGVGMRRTAAWMEQQILHPEIMVKQDPIARELRTHYSLPMTNQGLTPDEARAVIEFLKKKG